MRVTRAIREYVENEIKKKYQTKMNDIGKEYEIEREKVEEHIEKIRLTAEKEAQEYLDSVGYITGRYGKSTVFSTAYVRNEEIEQELSTKRSKLRDSQEEKIKQVLFDLEMGDTQKAELKAVLDNIVID